VIGSGRAICAIVSSSFHYTVETVLYNRRVPRTWTIPEGLRVLPDGSWRTGDLPVVHGASLRYMKERLVFEEAGAFVVDGPRRMPITVEGPAFEVVSLVLDPASVSALLLLDDGSSEPLGGDAALRMNETSGRFECPVRGGRARAVFSRAAHQTLLQDVEQEEGSFFLRVGGRRIAIST
jgi:hypothetical protein